MAPPRTSTLRTVPSAIGQTRADADRLYREYRRQQALRLLALLPEGAVRPLYRRAREWSAPPGDVSDPMTLLLDYCEEILPLPPFDVWWADREAHRAVHLDETIPGPGEPGSSAPVTVEVRTFHADGVPWIASLTVRPDGTVWRGHVVFHRHDQSSRSYPTGEIFNEDEAGTVRARFLGFDDRTLRAFLRSALP